VKRSLPLGAWLAIGFALAVTVPALAAGATWVVVGNHQRASMDARANEAATLLTENAELLGDSAVRDPVLDRLAAIDVEAEATGFAETKNPIPEAARKPLPSKSYGPLITKQLAAILIQPDGKQQLSERFERRRFIGGTLFIQRPSTGVRVAATSAAALVGIAIALVTGMLLLRRWVVRPLTRLAADAERIAGGQLDVAPVSSRTREVAEVGAALRGMAGGLRDALAERDAAEQQRRFLVGAVAHDPPLPCSRCADRWKRSRWASAMVTSCAAPRTRPRCSTASSATCSRSAAWSAPIRNCGARDSTPSPWPMTRPTPSTVRSPCWRPASRH
jgi:HAMP domain